MLSTAECNVLSSLSTERFKRVRAVIVSMVLATDMAAHFEFIAKFKNKLSGTGAVSNRYSRFQYDDPKDRQLLMDVAIKCGDINNAAKNNDLCKKWASRIMEEFFMQGDKEKASGLPVSMFMDRATTQVPKCQVGFIDFLAMPLFEVWGTYVSTADMLFEGVTNMSKNREYWKRFAFLDHLRHLLLIHAN
ncbi:High affinity cAMP-specific and IBMX-insensitive 3',5'-cyclic phosphodiesterase 8B [Cladochytrium tenue]|nr:High affinity cAMP-specific and IBMX-insensitive 3',5'-cyclic phosphodiesterase 8B [Cladochytrium tenue]